MNKNLKRMLLFINFMILNFLLMTTTHELIHYTQRKSDLQQICFLGYVKEIDTIAWFDDGVNEINGIDKEPRLSILSWTQFITITVIIGIVIKHKT